ncbi:MAG: bifunctional ADP-heptose synthase (sugar kinase/adenylyltransferase) [Pirellulaceae bacterium]|jgi:bifunctional ADP-heptose synthase (sugar kinase/adenylyltransferase)
MLTRSRLEDLLAQFPSQNIGLLGDLFLDRYLHLVPGDHEISIETGEEAFQIDTVRNSPGALGTVINNLSALGVGKLTPITVIGDDGHGYDLLKTLDDKPVVRDLILTAPNRLTPTYTKPMRPLRDGSWNELNRLDVRTRLPLDSETTERVCNCLEQAFHECGCIIVLDQVPQPGCGVVNQQVRECLEDLIDHNPAKPVIIDSRSQLHLFRRGILKGNEAEFLAATNAASTDEAAELLANKNGTYSFCTRGEHGIVIGCSSRENTFASSSPVAGEIDIVGAGDSATSGIAATLLAGGTAEEAAAVANLVAAVTVQQLGTTGTATPSDVLDRYDETQSAASDG